MSASSAVNAPEISLASLGPSPPGILEGRNIWSRTSLEFIVTPRFRTCASGRFPALEVQPTSMRAHWLTLGCATDLSARTVQVLDGVLKTPKVRRSGLGRDSCRPSIQALI